MSRDKFIRERKLFWEELERLIRQLERGKTKDPVGERFPVLYRRLCQDLALSRARSYGPVLHDQLNHLALRGHHLLYRRPRGSLARLLRFLTVDFPLTVRANPGLLWLATAAFCLPFATMVAAAWFAPDWLHAILGRDGAGQLESMYSPTADRVGRPPGQDSTMFGFYVHNNVGIAFRTFAAGILAGVGSLLILVFNGLTLGAATGHIHRLGYEETFYSFVCGHGAFELTGIVLAGMAGLKLGMALICPGRRRRSHALRENGPEALRILGGAAVMIFLAAFIEGFWSAGPASPATKYGVAAVLWSTTFLYLGLAGRSHGR